MTSPLGRDALEGELGMDPTTGGYQPTSASAVALSSVTPRRSFLAAVAALVAAPASVLKTRPRFEEPAVLQWGTGDFGAGTAVLHGREEVVPAHEYEAMVRSARYWRWSQARRRWSLFWTTR